MIYCQDCGAENPEGRDICSVCHRSLMREHSTRRCPSCREPLGEGASFCATCRAPVLVAAARTGASPDPPDPDAEAATAPRSAPIPSSTVGSAEAGPVAVHRSGADAPAGSAWPQLPHGTDRTADHTRDHPGPAVHTASGNVARVSVSVSETEASADAGTMALLAGTNRPLGDRSAVAEVSAVPASASAPAEPGAAPPPLPPLPDGGLSTVMPDWLRNPPSGIPAPRAPSAASTQSGALLPSPTASTPRPSPTTAADSPMPVPPDSEMQAIDTSGFISEDDLPRWIRRLVTDEIPDAAETRPSGATVGVPYPVGPEAGTGADASHLGAAPLPSDPQSVTASAARLTGGDRSSGGGPLHSLGSSGVRSDSATHPDSGHLPRNSGSEPTPGSPNALQSHSAAATDRTDPRGRQLSSLSAPAEVPAGSAGFGAAQPASPGRAVRLGSHRRTLLLALLILVVLVVVLYGLSGGFRG